MKTVTISKEDFQLIKSFYLEFKRAQGIQTNDYVIDWNELMPVVEKVRVMGKMISIEILDDQVTCQIRHEDNFGKADFHAQDFNSINAVYRCFVEFIKWYTDNQQKA